MAEKRESRRRFIAAVAGASVVGLSGCGSDGSETDEPDDENGTATDPVGTVAPADGKETATATAEPNDTPTETPTDTATETPADTATATPSAAELAEWPTYMYDTLNTGNHPDAVGPQGDVSVAWERDLDGAHVNATAVLGGGTLYVGDGRSNDDEGTLYALDPITGETQWQETLDGPITGGAVVDENGFVYIAASRDFVAYRGDGSEIWRFSGNAGLEFASPTFADGHVYFPADSGTLYKIEALSSERQWSYSTAGEIPSAPVVDDGMVYVPSRAGSVHAVTEGGSMEWEYDFESPVNGLSMHDGRLYAAMEDNRVAKLDTNGNLHWTSSLGDGVATTPAIAGDKVYVGTRNDAFVALDQGDGVEQWRYDDTNEPFTSPPVVVDGTVYTGCQDSRVYALDAESGEEQWSFGTGDNIVDPAPVVTGGRVYIGSRDGTFYALSD